MRALKANDKKKKKHKVTNCVSYWNLQRKDTAAYWIAVPAQISGCCWPSLVGLKVADVRVLTFPNPRPSLWALPTCVYSMVILSWLVKCDRYKSIIFEGFFSFCQGVKNSFLSITPSCCFCCQRLTASLCYCTNGIVFKEQLLCLDRIYLPVYHQRMQDLATA